MKATSFFLTGVGGQGILLASNVLTLVGAQAGFDVKKSEIHGMSQRGGSVTSHVRWGKVVHSPLIGMGEVDVLLAFEKLEALRSLMALHPGALVVINTQVIEPLTVISGNQAYPDDAFVRDAFAKVTQQAEYLNGEQIAGSLGNTRAANVVLLGALSALLERDGMAGPSLTTDTWLKVISERVPQKHIELNRKAFQAGREVVIHLA
jgi:indolepyruvate ferredoxin oxidoreductase beta subunit